MRSMFKALVAAALLFVAVPAFAQAATSVSQSSAQKVTYPLVCVNGSGANVACPAGTVWGATSSNPASLAAAVSYTGANNVGPQLTLTPLVQAGSYTVTLTASGMPSQPLAVTVTYDPTAPASIAVSTSGTTVVVQPTPANPGP